MALRTSRPVKDTAMIVASFVFILAGLALIVVLANKGSDADGQCQVGSSSHQVGDKWSAEGLCAEYYCLEDGSYNTTTCGAMAKNAIWENSPDKTSQSFPECCGRPVPVAGIVPDVLEDAEQLAATEVLRVVYGDITVDPGQELTPTQVKDQPELHFSADPDTWYLVAMVDPDAPSRQEPSSREFLHWLVVNTPGENVSAGEVLSPYVGSGPPQGSGLHRYVFLVYRQPGKLSYDEPLLTNGELTSRRKFSIDKFTKKYNLGNPVALNLYQAQWDEYVPILHQKLGISVKPTP